MLQRLSDDALDRHFLNSQMNLVRWRLWRLKNVVAGEEPRGMYRCVYGFTEKLATSANALVGGKWIACR